MLQQPEILDSLLAQIDTFDITLLDKARISTIRALSQNHKGEFKQCINELEKAERIFTDQGNPYHHTINKLIQAFTFEFIQLDNKASTLYLECEKYFKIHHHDVFRFYANLGLLRMAKHLDLDEKSLIDLLKNETKKLNDPNYDGLFYATLGNLENNDSIRLVYYELAKSGFSKAKRWSRVYATELNALFFKMKLDPPKHSEKYYNNFNKKNYSYTPTAYEDLRYQYGKACLYSIQRKNKESIAVAKQVLKNAVEMKVTKVEGDCVNLLSILYRRIGDYKNAHHMLNRYSEMQKKRQKDLQENRLLALSAYYRYSELEREKMELKVKVQQTLLILGLLCFAIVAIITAVWFFFRENKHKQAILKLQNIEIKDQMLNLISSLKQEENRNEHLIKQIGDLRVQYVESRKISEMLTAIEKQQFSGWAEFEAYFERLLPGWVEKLQKQAPDLTPTDLKYCMCLYFDMTNSMISTLCNVGMNGVKSAKKRIRNKLALNDASEIYSFLTNF